MSSTTGFTMIEAVVTIAIGTIVIAGIVGFMIEAGRLQTFISEQSEAIETANDATTLMTEALRETIDGADGSYALEVTDDNTMTFYSDVDADASAEQIIYALVGTDIIQSITEPTDTP